MEKVLNRLTMLVYMDTQVHWLMSQGLNFTCRSCMTAMSFFEALAEILQRFSMM